MSEAKIYVGTRNASGVCDVYVHSGTERVSGRRPLDPRRDVRDHSPDGFNWGYGGSGPSQLALAICCDALDGDTRRALAVYQEFKWAVIAPAEGDRFELGLAEALVVIERIERAATRGAQ